MQLTITQPDDWHLHLRDGEVLATTVAHSAAQFARAIIMPNLKPPVTTVESASAYRNRILAALPEKRHFEPLMTLYLTESTTGEDVVQAADSGFVNAFKYYPAGATTNSDAGVRNLENVYPVIERMEESGLVLCLHGEVVDSDIDIFDREAVFIERSLTPLVKLFPRLKIVLEHITTKDAAEFVADAPDNVAATLTPQHLLYNRNSLFQGGIRPHYYCLPILKREQHRQALQTAALSGNPKFFLGTDSAPHSTDSKETSCGCAGVYSAHAALELYAEFFDAHDALDKLESFASCHGADFYGLPRNTESITLVKEDWKIPDFYQFGAQTLTPFRAGEIISWRVQAGD